MQRDRAVLLDIVRAAAENPQGFITLRVFT